MNKLIMIFIFMNTNSDFASMISCQENIGAFTGLSFNYVN